MDLAGAMGWGFGVARRAVHACPRMASPLVSGLLRAAPRACYMPAMAFASMGASAYLASMLLQQTRWLRKHRPLKCNPFKLSLPCPRRLGDLSTCSGVAQHTHIRNFAPTCAIPPHTLLSPYLTLSC
jgi:hypothetical protein